MQIPVYLIVAVAENGVIGHDGTMPWRLSTDLKRFKSLTMGKPVVMGRKTWVSLGRPLPGRANIVITRDKNFSADGAIVVHSLSEGLRIGRMEAEKANADAVFVIGGGEIFREAMGLAQKMYVTEIQAKIAGDTYFPVFDPMQWRATFAENVPAGEKDTHASRFVVYERTEHA